jgi:hypothetical protein
MAIQFGPTPEGGAYARGVKRVGTDSWAHCWVDQNFEHQERITNSSKAPVGLITDSLYRVRLIDADNFIIETK